MAETKIERVGIEIEDGGSRAGAPLRGRAGPKRLSAMMDVPLDDVHCLYLEGSAATAAMAAETRPATPHCSRARWAVNPCASSRCAPTTSLGSKGSANAGRSARRQSMTRAMLSPGSRSSIFPGEPVTAPLIGATHAGLPSPPITEPAYHNIEYVAANSAIPYISRTSSP